MNICLFTSSFLPNVGGMENVVDTLAREYRALGHHVVVLAKTPKKMKKAPEFDYPVYYYKRSRSEIFFLGAPRKMLQKLHEQYHFDVIHAHQMYPTGYLAVEFRKKQNVPVLLTSHAGDVQDQSKYRKSWIKCRRMVRTMQQAPCVTAVGIKTCNEIDELTGMKKAIFLPNGCCPPADPEISANLKQKLEIPDLSKGFDLSVGRLHPAKGLDHLVRAFALLKERQIPTLPYLMAGSGQSEGELKALIAELNLEDRIFMLGTVTPEERDWLLRRCRFFFQPSLREGMPLTVLESLAAGAPVIGSDIPGIREILQDGFNGRTVPPGDHEALAEVLEKMTTEEEQMLRRNAAGILNTHSWTRIAEQYIALFEKLIRQNELN